MGEASTLLLDGQRAIPQKLEENGYKFKFRDINSTLIDILKD